MQCPGYLFLVCPDPELIKAHIRDRLAQSGVDGWEVKTFWGDDDDPLPQTFWTDLTIKSLFPEPKALVIRRAHSLKAEHWDKLDAGVKGLSKEILPIFCLEGQWKSKKPPVPATCARRAIYKKANAADWVWESPGLDRQSLNDFVRSWAQKQSLSFEPGADRALVQALPADGVAARLELDKLELAAGDERLVRREHIGLIAEQGEMEFFDLMDSLGKRGAEAAVWKRVIDDHFKASKDQMLFNLIGFLASQSRMYWMLIHGEENKVKAPPFIKKRKIAVARQLGKHGIARMIDLAMEAELGVKTGERKYDDVLDMLIAGLIDLFSGGQGFRRT